MGMSKTVSTMEAIRLVGVSRTTFWRLVKRYGIPTFEDVLDRRVKLIKRDDLDKLLAFALSVREGDNATNWEGYQKRVS